jgi:glycosyltransferase involved in cell wall biosynthesis
MAAQRAFKLALLGQYPLDERDFGGVYSHLRQLVEESKKHPGVEVHVITLSPHISSGKDVQEGRVTVHYLPSRLPRFLASLGFDQWQVIKKIREINPDVIHAQMTAPVYGLPAALTGNAGRVILTVHGIVREESKTWKGITGRLKGAIYGLMEDYALSHIPLIIAITPYVKRKIKPRTKSNPHVIPIGIVKDYYAAHGVEKEGRLLFVGGIEPRKGIIHLLEALTLLKGRKNLSLHIVGGVRDWACKRQLEDYMQKNGLEDIVSFEGVKAHKHLISEYAACSVFILPSSEESEGIVLLEAMAMGKPVVASRAGGIPDVVKDGVNGYLVPYADSRALAEKIALLLDSRKLRLKIGMGGRKTAAEYRPEMTAGKIYRLYSEVASS